MTKTVDDLRNEIREAVDRYERIESTAFTKEALAAICEAVDADIDTATTTPPKPAMRAAILDALDVEGDGETAFRKAQLQAIADAVTDE